jgi:hypothetical protein
MKLTEQVQRNVKVSSGETAHRLTQKPRQTGQRQPQPAGAMANAFAKLKR